MVCRIIYLSLSGLQRQIREKQYFPLGFVLESHDPEEATRGQKINASFYTRPAEFERVEKSFQKSSESIRKKVLQMPRHNALTNKFFYFLLRTKGRFFVPSKQESFKSAKYSACFRRSPG